MDTLLRDLRHALRALVRSPGFTLAAVAALTLGIGATTAVFSIVNAVLLRPAPFPDSARIVSLLLEAPQGRNPGGSPAKFAHWGRQTEVLQDVAAFRNGLANDTGGAVPEQLQWAQVSGDYFQLFGAPIVQGRAFAPDEDLPNGQKVALISEQLWERRFDRDPGVVGRTLSLSDEAHIVIGVVGGAFDFRDFGAPPDVWTPFQPRPAQHRSGPLLPRRGPAQTGRLAGPGPDRPGTLHRGLPATVPGCDSGRRRLHGRADP